MFGALRDNLLILQVMLPLFAAVVCALFPNRRMVVQVFVCSVTGISLLISGAIFSQVYQTYPILYRVGGWGPPYGIELKADLLSATMLLLVGFIAVMSVVYSLFPNRREVAPNKVSKFYSAFLLAFGGLLGILVSNDVFNVYVFLEIAAMASYVLVAMGNSRDSLVSAFEYLIIGTVGATLYLVGIGFLYAATGTLNMGDMFYILQELPTDRAIQAGILFVILGLVMKAALFPFHGWLVKAYTTSPAFISVFLSGTATKVMVYLVIRVLYSILGMQMFASLPWGGVLMTLAAVAVLSASVLAVLSKDIRDILAYSSIANIGCITFAICINTYSGLAAAVVYMVNHSVVKSALFMVSGGISYHFGRSVPTDSTSLSKALPHITGAFVLLSLSLVGMPPTLGFIAKWHILSSFMDASAWVGLAVLSIGSVCSVIYTWKVIWKLYSAAPTMADGCANDIALKTPRSMTACIWVMALLGLAAGAYPMPLTVVSEKIAADFFLPASYRG